MDEKDQALKLPKHTEDDGPRDEPAAPAAVGNVFPRTPEAPLRPPSDLKACRDCLRVIAHRMAQPMTALRGGIELGLMGKRTAPEYRTILEQALERADVMVQLIVSMRDLGEAIVPSDPTGHVDLEELIDEVLAEFEPLAQSRQLRFEIQPCERHGGAAADSVRLRKVLQDLVQWLVQNSAGGGKLIVKTKVASGMARVFFCPPRADQQYLQVKMLDDLTPLGTLSSLTAKIGGARWAMIQQAVKSLGGGLDAIVEGDDAGAICLSIPVASPR
jgi:hypothetical protein